MSKKHRPGQRLHTLSDHQRVLSLIDFLQHGFPPESRTFELIAKRFAVVGGVSYERALRAVQQANELMVAAQKEAVAKAAAMAAEKAAEKSEIVEDAAK